MARREILYGDENSNDQGDIIPQGGLGRIRRRMPVTTRRAGKETYEVFWEDMNGDFAEATVEELQLVETAQEDTNEVTTL